jgi:hypothetical protein
MYLQKGLNMYMMGEFVPSGADMRTMDMMDATAYNIKNAKYLDESGNLTQWAQSLPIDTLEGIALICNDDDLSHAIFIFLSSRD